MLSKLLNLIFPKRRTDSPGHYDRFERTRRYDVDSSPRRLQLGLRWNKTDLLRKIPPPTAWSPSILLPATVVSVQHAPIQVLTRINILSAVITGLSCSRAILAPTGTVPFATAVPAQLSPNLAPYTLNFLFVEMTLHGCPLNRN